MVALSVTEPGRFVDLSGVAMLVLVLVLLTCASASPAGRHSRAVMLAGIRTRAGHWTRSPDLAATAPTQLSGSAKLRIG